MVSIYKLKCCFYLLSI